VTVTDADDVSDPTPFVDTKTHHSTFDVEREAPSLALVEAIAAAKGTDPSRSTRSATPSTLARWTPSSSHGTATTPSR